MTGGGWRLAGCWWWANESSTLPTVVTLSCLHPGSTHPSSADTQGDEDTGRQHGDAQRDQRRPEQRLSEQQLHCCIFTDISHWKWRHDLMMNSHRTVITDQVMTSVACVNPVNQSTNEIVNNSMILWFCFLFDEHVDCQRNFVLAVSLKSLTRLNATLYPFVLFWSARYLLLLIPTMHQTPSHSDALFFTFLFLIPGNLYYRGYKNNNNNMWKTQWCVPGHLASFSRRLDESRTKSSGLGLSPKSWPLTQSPG